jgi:hypothetical protein
MFVGKMLLSLETFFKRGLENNSENVRDIFSHNDNINRLTRHSIPEDSHLRSFWTELTNLNFSQFHSILTEEPQGQVRRNRSFEPGIFWFRDREEANSLV